MIADAVIITRLMFMWGGESMIELKPCPFCGRKIYDYSMRIEIGIPDELKISCCCGADFCIRESRIYEDDKRFRIKSAIDIWNNRKEAEE